MVFQVLGSANCAYTLTLSPFFKKHKSFLKIYREKMLSAADHSGSPEYVSLDCGDGISRIIRYGTMSHDMVKPDINSGTIDTKAACRRVSGAGVLLIRSTILTPDFSSAALAKEGKNFIRLHCFTPDKQEA